MKTVFMTGAGGGMGFESFRQMLPDIGKKYNVRGIQGPHAVREDCRRYSDPHIIIDGKRDCLGEAIPFSMINLYK